MALAEIANGNQTAVISTEHTLVTDTTGKTYVAVVDINNLAAGDTLLLRIYTIVRAAGTERLAYVSHSGPIAPTEKILYSVPVPANRSFKLTLTQTAGTGRTYEWAVLSLD
jgi:hypothetical protein